MEVTQEAIFARVGRLEVEASMLRDENAQLVPLVNDLQAFMEANDLTEDQFRAFVEKRRHAEAVKASLGIEGDGIDVTVGDAESGPEAAEPVANGSAGE
jgi:uncharacterized protein YlxW (UPF0749 family)